MTTGHDNVLCLQRETGESYFFSKFCRHLGVWDVVMDKELLLCCVAPLCRLNLPL